ncbi:MAG: C4-dicarboxylate ABC transporter, partial [Gammaproteobacteria bacterium]
LGTPTKDDSTHRISQKAVENLASIGGGGAADLVSRSFLRLFDTFGYDRLGLGCYLHDGVCQIMGVEPAKQGYYIVKGGGLPRIDVIGYNPRIDWNVLLSRLARITVSSEAVVK